MVTTVQVQEDTVQLLQQERKVMGANSYDEVIKKLLTKNRPDLLRGFLGKGNFKKFLTGLREKHDRY